MINTSETISATEKQEEFRLFHLDSEISQLPENDEKRKVLEQFTSGHGVWRLADYLNGRTIINPEFKIEDGKKLMEEGDFNGIVFGILTGHKAVPDMSGKLFEEIALSTLTLQLPQDEHILPPDESEKVFREIEEKPFSTTPDGLIFKNNNLVAVAEYNHRASLIDDKRKQYEALREIVEKLGLEQGLIYVVPSGGAQSLALEESEAKVVESPLTKKDTRRFLAAFLLDYLDYKQGLGTTNGPSRRG